MSDELTEDEVTRMMEHGTFIVSKPFKYGGKMLNIGDPWKPGAGKYDRQIIAQGILVKSVAQVKAVPARRKNTLKAFLPRTSAPRARRKEAADGI